MTERLSGLTDRVLCMLTAVMVMWTYGGGGLVAKLSATLATL